MEKNKMISNGKKFWRGLDHIVDSEKYNELAEKEFVNSPFVEGEGDSSVARRDFLKLMGASLAMGATACIRRPTQNIVPYSTRPPELVPGVANYYTSTLYDGGSGYGVVVKTREGRPIHLSGNPNFPSNKNGVSARAHAHVVSLYDPDRLKGPKKRKASDKDFHKRFWDDITWEKLDDAVVEVLDKGKVAILTNSIASPSTQLVIDDFLKGIGGQHYQWEALNVGATLEATQKSFGRTGSARYLVNKAKFILSVGSDFLHTHPQSVDLSRQFAEVRKPGAEMTKLVVMEGNYTLTGANADTRIRVQNSNYADVILALAYEIVSQGHSKYASNSSIKSVLSKFSGTANRLGIEADLFAKIAEDLWMNRGKSLVLAATEFQGPEAVEAQIAANFLNSLLGNEGKTIDGSNIINECCTSSNANLNQLIKDIDSGKVKTLIVHGTNPVYSLPKSSGFEKALEKLDMLLYTGLYHDETGDKANFLVPTHHALEAWGDAEFESGVYAVQQPTIRPLYKTRAFEESLMNWAYMLEKSNARIEKAENFYQYLRNHWRDSISKKAGRGGRDFESFWVHTLKTGVYNTSASKRSSASARNFKTSALSAISPQTFSGDFELVLYSKAGIGNGEYANIPWLQELPDPVTKVVWDNYLNISLKTANQLKLKTGDVVELTAGDTKMRVPVLIQVGQHDKVVSLAVGYGRTRGGKVCRGVGVNAYEFAKVKDGEISYQGISASIKKTGDEHELANTQGHHYMEGRSIVIEATLESYLKDKSSGIHRHELLINKKTGDYVNIWPEKEYKGHKWGMSIDQNACIGCSACVVACQSENNIPVVGKKYVIEGREMHWMRIDRYYSGEVANPDAYFQPQLCQHCDNAPCETVCPVAATSHSDEGLNEMTYNRCVGTRYCSNNCPYKSRRFNWFAYTLGRRPEDTPKEAYNPDVTVRSRGVMEKCTFCVQRIHEAKHKAKYEKRELKDGDITVACEASCPTNAIVFGDMNNPNSRVAKLHTDPRSYKVLEEVYAEPAVRYMTKIRNAEATKTHKEGEGH